MERRQVLVGAAAVVLSGGAAEAGGDRLVLLGTKGGPSVRGLGQLPSSNLLVVGGTPYVVDAGYGATYRLVEQGVALPSIRAIFVTHHHSDHNLEVGTVIYNAWANGLQRPIDVYGPAGVERLLAAYFESNVIDIEVRMVDEGRPDLRLLAVPHVYSEGPVMGDGQVEVSALRVRHPPIEAYALRFATASGKVIVFSGDTTYFPPLADFARGADVLVHEVMYGPALDRLVALNPAATTLMSHLRAAHTTTEDVGRIAAAAGVKTLVLTHFVPGDMPSVTPEDWTRGVRAHYAGPIVLGHDGLEMLI